MAGIATLLPWAMRSSTAARVAWSRSGHRKNLNPVTVFARFGDAGGALRPSGTWHILAGEGSVNSVPQFPRAPHQ